MSDLLRLSSFVRDFYVSADRAVEKALESEKVSCRKGCSYCCHQMVAISGPEAVRHAHLLLERNNWKDYLPLLRDAALHYCEDGLTKKSYFLKRIPCVFLKAGLCEIYDERPLPCRLHFVGSDPGNCNPDHETGRTLLFKFNGIEERMWKLSAEVFSELVYGPFPLMLIHMVEAVLHAKGIKDTDLIEALNGIPDPHQWVERYGLQIAISEEKDEHQDIQSVSAEGRP